MHYAPLALLIASAALAPKLEGEDKALSKAPSQAATTSSIASSSESAQAGATSQPGKGPAAGGTSAGTPSAGATSAGAASAGAPSAGAASGGAASASAESASAATGPAKEASEPAQAPSGSPAPAPKRTPAVVRAAKDGLLGTRAELQLFTDDEAGARLAIEAAFQEIGRIESQLSELKPGSEVSRLNQSAGREPAAVSSEAAGLLSEGKGWAQMSKGAFAMSAAALAPLWDFERLDGSARPPDEGKRRERAALVDDSKLAIDGPKATLPAGMSISTRGLLTGYAARRVLALLAEKGFHNALLTIGGFVAAAGKKGEKPWLVGIQDPRGAGYFATLPISNEAVSTRGDYERFFIHAGVRYHDVLDPRTGLPANGCRSVTVVGKDPVAVQALSLAVMVLGPKEGLALIDAQPGYGALVVDAENNVVTAKGQKDRLRVIRAPTN